MSPLTVLKVDKTTDETIKVANTKFRILDSNKNPISMKESSIVLKKWIFLKQIKMDK